MHVLIFVYGVVSYVLFLVAFLYAIAFVGDFAGKDAAAFIPQIVRDFVPKSIDTGAESSLGLSLAVNIALLALFAVQHSVMARPAFKERWMRIIPAAMERSTYVLLTSLILFLLYWQWRPLPEAVWSIDNGAVFWGIHALSAIGWLTVLASTFMIDHFELFGLKQSYLCLMDREPTPTPFKTVMLYRYVRHPLMLGFIIAFWAAPVMSGGHLLFAAVITAYVLIAIQLEERDLVASQGEQYREYQRTTPMLLPLPGLGRGSAPTDAGESNP